MTEPVALAWLELQIQAARGELGSTQGQRRHHQRQAIAWATGPGRNGPLSPRAIGAALGLTAREIRARVRRARPLRAGDAPRRRRGRPCTSSRPAFTPLAPAVSELLAHATRGLRQLAAAILQRALADLEGPASLADHARVWIQQRGGAHIFSFEGTCELLGQDPQRVRRAAIPTAEMARARAA